MEVLRHTPPPRDVWAGKPEAIAGALGEGVRYEGLELGVHADGDDGPDDADRTDALHQQFVIGETLALLHHVAETLLRFFLAHEAFPPCPWIEIVSERRPGDFKRKVAARFDGQPLSPGRRADLANVYFGRESPQAGADDEARWNADLENIEQWLGHFAARFTGEASVWNAVKHWLAVQPSDPRMQIGPLVTECPGVTYLERGDAGRWNLAARWTTPITLDRLMGEIYIANSMLRTIWEVGRYRYLGDARTLLVYTGPSYVEYTAPAEGHGPVASVRADILYLHPILVCFKCGREPREGEDAVDSSRVYENGEREPRIVCAECLDLLANETA